MRLPSHDELQRRKGLGVVPLALRILSILANHVAPLVNA